MNDKIRNDIINNRNFYKESDTFHFSCKQCGKCCSADILLTAYDAFNICRHLNITGEEFVQKYCELYIGPDSKLPLIILKKTKMIVGGRLEDTCPFLKKEGDKNKCSIHGCKPTVCKLYPLGRINMEDDYNEFKYHLQQTSCNKKQDQHIVGEWLDEFNTRDSEEPTRVFYSYINKFYGLLKLDEVQKSSKELFSALSKSTAIALYYAYDYEKDFIEQYKHNLETVLKQYICTASCFILQNKPECLGKKLKEFMPEIEKKVKDYDSIEQLVEILEEVIIEKVLKP